MRTTSKVTSLAAVALLGLTAVAQAGEPAPAPQKPLVMGSPDNTFQTFFLSPEERARTGNGPTTPIADGDLVGPLARATTFSRDRSRALWLYRDVLGFVPRTDTYWRGLAINRVKGTEGLEQHAVILMAGHSGEGNIGVYQLYGERFPPPPVKRDAKVEMGDYALTFHTNDIQKVFEGAKDIGFTIIMPPTVRPNGETRLVFRGPDGVIHHFIQPG